MQRRELITAGVAAVSVQLAGCAGGDVDEESNSDGGSSGSDASSSGEPVVDGLQHDPYMDSFKAGVEGIAVNNTDSQLSYAQVEATFYDASDVRVGKGPSNASELAPGEKFRFDCT